MIDRALQSWRSSVTTQLMTPVGIMVGLVLLLGLIDAATRTRVAAAHREVEQAQEIHIGLIEARSISRSLQRDVLNLAIEPQSAERALIAGKVTARSRTMAALLRSLAAKSDFAAPDRAVYFIEQGRVLRALEQAASLARQGDRAAALSAFRGRIRPLERHASRIADRLVARQSVSVAHGFAAARHAERWQARIAMGASIALLLAAALAAFLLTRRLIARPLREIEDVMTRIVHGEVAGAVPHVDRADEIGRMARAIEVFRTAMVERDRARDAQARQLERSLADERRQRAQDEAANRRSEALAIAATRLETDTETPLVDGRAAAVTLDDAARDLADLSASTRVELVEVRAATSRVTENAGEIAVATQQFMAELDRSRGATHVAAGEGRDAAAQVEALVVRMRRVEEDTHGVGRALDLVAGIARQTNLLAINASIEAARGGDASRGFAVVAGEVKALASETARATHEIAQRVADMRTATSEAGKTLGAVGGTIAGIVGRSADLAADIDAQADQGRAISLRVASTAADLDLIVARVANASAAAERVDALSKRLRHYAEGVAGRTSLLTAALDRFFTGLRTLTTPQGR